MNNIRIIYILGCGYWARSNAIQPFANHPYEWWALKLKRMVSDVGFIPLASVDRCSLWWSHWQRPSRILADSTNYSWWRHQMETFSALLAICVGNSPVTGEFPTQRPVTRSFDGFFDLCMNKRWSKQWWGWWFKTPSRPLWRHCNDYEIWSTLKRIHSSFTHVGHFYVLHTVKVLGIIQCIYGLQSVNMYFELKKNKHIEYNFVPNWYQLHFNYITVNMQNMWEWRMCF